MITVKMLDAQGKYLGRDCVFSIYPTDMRHVPFNRNVVFKGNGEINLECSELPVILHGVVPIPGYGRTWVTIDNCGEGYKDGAVIDFVREGAVSRAWLVEREINKGGFAPSAKCLSLLNDAKALIQKAASAPSPKCYEYNMTALGAGMWAGELMVVERARTKIAAAKRKDFLFGCGFGYPFDNIPGAQEMFDSLFNYMTLPFYLASVEPEKGKPNYDRIDGPLEAIGSRDILTKGHPLWWGFGYRGAGTPQWAENYNWDEVQRTIKEICTTRVGRYRDSVKIFDVINEAHDWANTYNLTQDQQIEATKLCCDYTHETNPDVQAVINICQPYGEYGGQGKILYGPVYDRIMTPLSYFERVRDRGIQYEILGIQLYNPARDMLSIEQMLDRYAVFGKPIHITELGVASYDKNMPYNYIDLVIGGLMIGLWHDFQWNERLQADWLEDFYTICYAHNSVEACTWWNFTDPAFCPASGFYDEDGREKEINYRLKALQQSWGFNFGKKQ